MSTQHAGNCAVLPHVSGQCAFFEPDCITVPELKAVIDAQWAEHERLKKTGKLVPEVFHRDGKPIVSMLKAFKSACRNAGCPGRILHDLRRTAVRNLERAGVPRAQAMLMTGHKTESVYRRYAIASEADLEVAGERLGALFTSHINEAVGASGT